MTNTDATTYTTYTAVIRTPNDTGYEDLVFDSWVLENADGQFEADLFVPDRGYLDDIEAAVAKALFVPVDTVTATPEGGNIGGETSHRNAFISADQWSITVTR